MVFSIQHIHVRPGMTGEPCALCNVPIASGVLLRVPNWDDPENIGGALLCDECAAGLRDALAQLPLPPSEPEAFTVVNPAAS